jgi:hypothetical protein
MSLPLGVNLDPRGEICILGECSPICSPQGVNTLQCVEKPRDEQRASPPGDNFNPRGQSSPSGQFHLWDSHFAPWCEIKNWSLSKVARWQTKNPYLGKIWRDLPWKILDYFYGHWVYFTTIWYILRPFGIFSGHLVYFIVIWYVFPALVCCTKKNLATQPLSRSNLEI